jgi:hypothetical protein
MTTAVSTLYHVCEKLPQSTTDENNDLTTIVVYNLKTGDGKKRSEPHLFLDLVLWRYASSPYVQLRFADCGRYNEGISVRSELQMRSLIDVPNTDYIHLDKHFVVLKGNANIPLKIKCTNTLHETVDTHFPSKVLYNYIDFNECDDQTGLLNRFANFCWNILSQ